MVKDLVIGTQYLENYGAHSWDGQGDCPQYWKAKGGDETIVTNIPEGTDIGAILDQLRSDLEWSSNFSKQYIVGYALQESNYKTDFERDQEEFDGAVAYPAHRIDYSEIKLEMSNV